MLTQQQIRDRLEEIERQYVSLEGEARGLRFALNGVETSSSSSSSKKTKVYRSEDSYRRAIEEFGTRKFTTTDLAHKLNVHPGTARDHLVDFEREGFVTCDRNGKPQAWRLGR